VDDAQLKLRYLKINFVGLGLIGSVLMYAAVVEVLKRVLAPFTGLAGLTPDQTQMVKYLLVALALGDFFLIKALPRILGARTVEQLAAAAIVTFALCEAVGLFGLILFLMGGNAMDFYTFMFLSLFYFWFFFPKYQDWATQLGVGAEPAPK
jgi:hypothetical protein